MSPRATQSKRPQRAKTAASLRVFQRTVKLTTQAEYRLARGALRLSRWRLVADELPGPWMQAVGKADLIAGWPRSLPANYATKPSEE